MPMMPRISVVHQHLAEPGKVARLRRSVDHKGRDPRPRQRDRGRRRLPAALARVVQGRDHVEARACARGAVRERCGRYLGGAHALGVGQCLTDWNEERISMSERPFLRPQR